MSVTPMMAQYLEIKASHSDALLLYRMGDFYEMFFDDAVAAAEALDIALTKRGQHKGKDIPMCGVPYHAAEGYFLTLIRKGFRVAVCEQLEDPAEAKKRRGHKAVVKRGVVRIVTPGTLTEDALLDARRNNYLAAYSEFPSSAALAWVDMSTGALAVVATTRAKLSADLARLAPAELLCLDTLSTELAFLETDLSLTPTPLDRGNFDSTSAYQRLNTIFQTQSLDAFGHFDRVEVSAMGALLAYLQLTQRSQVPHLGTPRREMPSKIVQIDAATRRNLELTRSLDGQKKGSLLSVLDRTRTALGARLLDHRLSAPLSHLPTLLERQEAVQTFVANPDLRELVRTTLDEVPDIERSLSRLSLMRGGPRDLGAIRTGIDAANILYSLLKASLEVSNQDKTAIADLVGFEELSSRLSSALEHSLPLSVRDGGFITPGADANLDEARTLRDEGKSVIARYQTDYRDQTRIASLKIKHNRVLGYFVEVSSTHAAKMLEPPFSEDFIHRQTTANQARFTTPELSQLENQIHTAGEKAQAIEEAHFDALRQDCLTQIGRLYALARALAEIDVSSCLAEVAVTQDWARPVLNTSCDFDIIDGRHPVVEAALDSQGGNTFIPNSCDLSCEGDEASICLLTGPNMAGKSTYLRQNALITILAQIGSFVPAAEARIGLVDKIFSRVGASDDLARGRSTFMVEMVETAAILNQATERSLVILDEIGRGTSTYDGLSIAWATLEYLHDVNRCRALFATHYHELTSITGRLSRVENATVSVREWEGDIVFLHEVKKGAADRSYGVQVARLAGLPSSVISRARTILEALEKEKSGSSSVFQAAVLEELPLFSAASETPKPMMSPVEVALADIHPDELSPREALDTIYELKSLAKQKSKTGL